MKRKMLSILLALCMVCSLLPTMAFAEVEEAHHTCDASCGHVAGDPHSDSELTWTSWTDTTALPSSGNYYLTVDVTLSAQQTVSGTLNLCLNGHTIKPSRSGFCAIKVTGNLSLTDCRDNGEIAGFTNNAGKGGAVYSTGTFTMYGGIISGNIAETIDYPYYRMGGGVYSEGTFTMYGGTISGNTSPSYGGGVYSKGTFTMYGGTIRGNKVGAEYNTDSMGGGVYSGGTFTMHGGTISGNEAQLFGGGVYIAPDKQFTMDGGTISDNKVTTKGNMYNYGGGGVYSEGDFTMSGGTISGNEAGRYGGGVYIGNNNTDSKTPGTFTMSSGTISGNKAFRGGGVYINSHKEFTMNGGTISGNNAISDNNVISSNNAAYGGGVCVNGTFEMSNGTISGNNAIGGDNAGCGGGVYIGDTFTMTGGTITENAATTYGGGVYMYMGAEAFNLSGSPTISGNTRGNCYIYNNGTYFMTVTGALSENAKIGITTWDQVPYRPFCKPANNTINLSDYENWFFSDSVDYAIAKNDDGSLYTKEVPTYTVTFNANGATGTAPTQSKTAAGGTFLLPAATDLAKAGYTFAGWNDGTTTYQAGATYTMPASAVTFIAQWEVIPTYTVTFDANGATGTAPTQVATAEGGTFLLPAATDLAKAGYTFAGWNDGTTTYQAGATYTMPASAVTFIAQWEVIPTYTVTFDANGHGTAPDAQTVTSGATATEPAALTENGYTFGGWYTDENCTAVFDFTTAITGNTTLYAKWTEDTPITYTVTFDANGHGTAPDAIESVTSGSTITAPTAPTADGYTFGGWYTDASCTAAFDFATAITGNITLYAKWTQNAPTPPPATTYDIWIGNVPVTSANKDDIVVPRSTGTATYDPDTKTLTLTNFKHAGKYWPDEAAESSAIRVKENGITIVFSGENMIEGTGDCGLYADVVGEIKLKAADKNSTLTFTCENGHAFSHNPEFVGSIAIYAGSSEADAKFRTHSAFAKDPHPYDFKYVKFVPATPTPPIATPTPSVKMDVEDATLNDAAKAVGSAVKSGNADIIPAEGYTKESIAKMQNSGELNLAIEKNAGYDEAEKKLLDDAITAKGGAAGSVMYLEIDALLMSDDGKVVAEVDDTIVDLTITVELNAEMQKAAKEGKTIYVARAHDGKVAFLEGTLNADKTKLTFDSSKFSTYALVAFDSGTITSAQTADAGIFLAVSMSVLSVTGSAVLLKKKED